MAVEHYDLIVVGGGIYGSLGAELAGARGSHVALIEREDRLLGGASAINQARVHNGYHYPRSLSTAARSHANYERFQADFGEAIVQHDCLYAVARFGSRVTASQFERFCSLVGIPLSRVDDHPELVDPRAVAALWRADEAVFDADTLRALVHERVRSAGVEIMLASAATDVDVVAGEASVVVGEQEYRASLVLDCTYGELERRGIKAEGVGPPFVYELAEIALVEVPEEMRNVGLTVMDGPFFSCIPSPLDGCHSLTHVSYTPHAAGDGDAFPWEVVDRPPGSRFELMRRAAAPVAPWIADAVHVASRFAVKAIPHERDRDDARPIVVHRSGDEGPVVSVVGGKLDNVYDFLSWLSAELR